jgi:D-alanyl-D-alanine carboxypeptidase
MSTTASWSAKPATLALATICALSLLSPAPADASPAPATCPAPPAVRPDPAQQTRPLDQAALKATIAGLPAADATAALVRVGGTAGSWRGRTGTADLRTRRPAQPDARFRAGSVTKMFTTAVVLQLVAEGRIDLDDRVQDRLPGLLPARYPAVTLGQLLSHTSGLPGPVIPADFGWAYRHRFEKWTPQEYVRQAVRHPIEFRPGTRQHYLDINTVVAGLIIEEVTDGSYERAVAGRVLRPLGLRHTYFPGAATHIRGPHHRGYQVVADPGNFPQTISNAGTRVVDVTAWSQSDTWASGDLISTTADLERFVTALFSGRVVPRTQLTNMFTVPAVFAFDGDDDCHDDVPATFTMGMTRLALPGGIVVYGKTGGRHGYATGVAATRDLSRSLVFSINSTDAKGQGQNQRGLPLAVTAFAGADPDRK